MIGEICLTMFLVWLIWNVTNTYSMRRKLPPGPFPLPFLGNLPHMLCDPVNPFGKLAERYGDIFTLSFPNETMVVLNTASLAREAKLQRKDDLAGKSPKSLYPFGDILGEDLGTADYSTAFLFRKRVFRSALHIFGAGVEQAEDRMRYAVETALREIKNMKGQPFSPKELLESSILVQLWEWITSKTLSLHDPTIEHLREFGDIVSKQALQSSLYQLLPFLAYFPTKFTRDIDRAHQLKNSLFPPEFRAHLETYTTGVVRDLTDSFISAYEKEIAKETGKDIGSIEDIPNLMLDVAFLGSDTTSTSLAWFILYVLLHDDVQQKIHQELDAVMDKNSFPRWRDAEKCPYLQATLCEVQRISGIALIGGTNAIRDTTIAGYSIPRGTFVALNYTKLHHDERDWPEPNRFKPERFLDSEGMFIGWSTHHAFIPFSLGLRECAGQSLAKMMMFNFAAALFHRYVIELPEGAKRPSTDISGPALVVRPQDFKVVARKRL